MSHIASLRLTEVGLVLTALDLHSPWPCFNEEMSHQLFLRIPCERRGGGEKK